MDLSIIDVQGVVLYKRQLLNAGSGWQSTSFHPANLPEGVYQLLLKSRSDTAVAKLLVGRK